MSSLPQKKVKKNLGDEREKKVREVLLTFQSIEFDKSWQKKLILISRIWRKRHENTTGFPTKF